MRYAQLVMGPAGCGKSTYCSTIQRQVADENKVLHIVNLDPAAEFFDYKPMADIRDLIHLDDVMDDAELKFGPNGGLVFCMEYLVENISWLEEQLGDVDGDYIIFDCPGQIELYTHMRVIQQFTAKLENLNFRTCGVFLMDTQFLVDVSKFISGTMVALSAMINLELPHINILSKIDLLSKSQRKQLGKYLEPNPRSLLAEMDSTLWNDKYRRLTKAIGELLELEGITFYPLNIKDEENIAKIKMTIDNAIQYGEDEDVQVRDFN